MTFIPLKIGVVTDTAKHYKHRFKLTDEQCGELSSQVQVDATVDALRVLGHEVEFIGSVFELIQRLAPLVPGQKAPWDLIFNAAEGMFGIAREAQVPALLEAYRIPFTFADASAMIIGLDKALSKLKLVANQIPTPTFFLVPPAQAGLFHFEQRSSGVLFRHRDQEVIFPSFPLFIKPNAEGSSKGVDEKSKINCISDIQPAIDHLAIQYPDQDLLIETFLAGREYSVAILGTGEQAKVLGTINSIISSPDPNVPNNVEGRKMGKTTAADFLTYTDKVESGNLCTDEHIDSALVAEAERLALKTHIILGMRDCSRVDVRDDKFGPDAKPYVIEANAIPGLVPNFSTICILASNHGMSYVELINRIVESARERVK